MKSIFISFITLFIAVPVFAENWDNVRTSGEYYYGTGVGATEAEAEKAALGNLIQQIATNVSSDFTQIDDIKNRNGNTEHNSRVLNCIKTYSQATLTNVERMAPEGSEPNITARLYMKKSELQRIYDGRVAKARGYYELAEQCLEDKKLDMALQFYYWGYSLIRSIQFPNEVKDERGRPLADLIYAKIELILSDISIEFDKRVGDNVDLLFKYKGEPVVSLDFTYSDGRDSSCPGIAKSGWGPMQMIPDYETDTYHLDIEYQYKNQAGGDAEMKSVLDVITPRVFPKSAFKITAKNRQPATPAVSNQMTATQSLQPSQPVVDLNSATLSPLTTVPEVSDHALPAQSIDGIVKALSNRQYSDAHRYFTLDGLARFNRLTGYGNSRVLDASNIRYYKGLDGKTVARGLKMAFAFNGRRKKTFVEDVSFTFNEDNKIENVAFGLGDDVENGIFHNKASWNDDVREIIVSFMENYKTAYSLENLDYLRQIFDDNAVIIVGNVLRRHTANNLPKDELTISDTGKDVIKYNRYTKDQYLDNLKRCFFCNDFINLKFTRPDIQWLDKFNDKQIFAINIRQEYESTNYSDEGFLFLLVDMTDTKEPLIKVRTWQPHEASVEKLYHAGYFFND